MTIQKAIPRVINYSDYKHFDNENCGKELLTELSNSFLRFDYSGFSDFFDSCRVTLDQHAPLIQKYVQDNLNKTFSKEI